MPLHPQAKAFLKAQESLDAPDITTNLVEYRAMSHLDDDLAGPLTLGVRIEHRYLTSPTADLPVNLYIPKGNGPFNGLVYFHGGGWVLNNLDIYVSYQGNLLHIHNRFIQLLKVWKKTSTVENYFHVH